MLGKSVASLFWMLIVGFKSVAQCAGGVDRGSIGARLKPWVLNAVFFLSIVLGAMVQGSTPAIADNCPAIPTGSFLNGQSDSTLTCSAGSGIDATAALNIVNTTNGTGGGTVSFSAGAASGFSLGIVGCGGPGCNVPTGPVFVCNSSVGQCTFVVAPGSLSGPGGAIFFRGTMQAGSTSITGGFTTRLPDADAGANQTVASGSTFTLDGSASGAPASEINDSITSYTWARTNPSAAGVPGSGPIRTLTAPTLNVGDSPLTLTYRLDVLDGFGATDIDTVNVTVNPPPNNPPSADAGPDQTGVVSGAVVTLDGSASSDSDPGDSIASFAWAQTAGTSVTLSSTSAAGPTFTAPTLNPGDPSVTLTFELTVTDTQGATDTDTVSITVDAPPGVPEIEISSSETGPVADGGTDALGSEPLGVPKSITYTVTNTGTAVLSIPSSTFSASNLVNVFAPNTGTISSNMIPPGGSGTITVTFTPNASGPFSFDLDLVSNDADENPYDITVSGTAFGIPEIDVSSSESGAVADGGTDAQGSEPAGVAKTVTYTINNTGTDTLTLSGTPTTSNPVNVGSLTVSPPASNTIAAGASTTFTVSYTPTIAGAFSFDLDIGSDDADENPYDIAVSGTATGAPEIDISSSETGPVADGGTDSQGSEPAGVAKTVT
ncbi:MAG: choice-of-anchor D domain-containing protein, partial [Pseudomonadota bacterium]